MFFSTHLFIFILCISFSLSSSTDSCHLRELEFCSATLLVFTKNTQVFSGTETEIDHTCGFIKEAQICARNFTQRCLSESQLELLDFLVEGSRNLTSDFCTPGTALRSEFKKHGPCLSETRAQSKRCTKDLQKSLEEVISTSWDNRISMACCGYNRFRECLADTIIARCGQDAFDLSNKIVRLYSTKLPEILCQSYPHSSAKCSQILPLEGSEPSGARSSSFLSRVLSSFIGN